LSFAPFFIAQEEGYFADEGLEVEFVPFKRSSEAIVPLVQGELDVLAGTISFGLLNAMNRGSNIQFVADRGYVDVDSCLNGGILARRSLLESGQLDGPEQIEGLRVAVNPAAARGYFVDLVLEQAGLTYDDIEVVDVSNPALIEAMANGSIDLAVTSEPWVTRLIDEGGAEIWLPYGEIVPGFQLGYVAYGPSLLEENPEAGQRFMNAYLKAVRQYKEGKTERNVEILSKYTELDQEFLRQVCWQSFADGEINVESVLAFQDWALKNGYLDGLVPEEQFWNPSFVQEAKD
jgi:NitT/TauT family transport system substrate-binding protein